MSAARAGDPFGFLGRKSPLLAQRAREKWGTQPPILTTDRLNFATARDSNVLGLRTRYNHRKQKLSQGDEMDGWKKAVVMGSIGAAALLFMKKRYPAGVLATGVGLAVLASEYPEKFEQVKQALPDYFERGMRVMEMAGQAGRRITSAAGQSAYEAWEEIGG